MDIIYSVIYGIVQGLTEFIPVSSSGHLVILHSVLKIHNIDSLTFDVALHFGTLCALLVFFKSELFLMFKAFFNTKRTNEENNRVRKLTWYLVFSSVPAAIAGMFLENIISSLRIAVVVIVMLVLGGALFLLIERFGKKDKDISSINSRKSLLLGVFQAVALIPGTSRSGITIIAGMAIGLKREAAAKFSFLMAIPVVFGASVKKMYDMIVKSNPDINFNVMLIGFAASFVTGYIAIKFLLKYLQNHSLKIFAWYRFFLAFILAVLLYLSAA